MNAQAQFEFERRSSDAQGTALKGAHPISGQRASARPRRRLTLRDESRAAYEGVKATKSEIQQRIVDYARSRGEHGFTADELAAEWRCSINHVAPRCCELRKDGRLVVRVTADGPVRRRTRSDCWAAVLVTREFAG